MSQLENYISKSVLTNYFQGKLKNITGKKYEFNFQIGYNRCMARVWDHSGKCNFNLRCKSKALGSKAIYRVRTLDFS